MNKLSVNKLRLVFQYVLFTILVSLSVLLTGCVYDPIYYGPPPHTSYHPHYYDYYFYPSVQVYFHFTTGFYYYLDGRTWIRTRVLPPHIHIDTRDRVQIRIDSDKPYLKLPEHTRIYKPKPNYRVDKERSIKEQEANKRWFQEFEKKKIKPKKKPKDKR